MADYYAGVAGRKIKFLGSIKSAVINNDLDHILALDSVDENEESYYVVAEFNYASSKDDDVIPTILYEGKSHGVTLLNYEKELMKLQSNEV